jgi:hypothetical protein
MLCYPLALFCSMPSLLGQIKRPCRGLLLQALLCYYTLHCYAAAMCSCKLLLMLIMSLHLPQATNQGAQAICKGEGSDIMQLTLQTWQPMTSCASCPTLTTNHYLPEDPGASLPEGRSESTVVELHMWAETILLRNRDFI